MYSVPAALSCATNSAPPVPCTSRIAAAGACVRAPRRRPPALARPPVRPAPPHPRHQLPARHPFVELLFEGFFQGPPPAARLCPPCRCAVGAHSQSLRLAHPPSI